MTEPSGRIGMATFTFEQWCLLMYELADVSAKLQLWEQEILASSLRVMIHGDEQERTMAAHTIAEVMTPAATHAAMNTPEEELFDES